MEIAPSEWIVGSHSCQSHESPYRAHEEHHPRRARSHHPFPNEKTVTSPPSNNCAKQFANNKTSQGNAKAMLHRSIAVRFPNIHGGRCVKI